MNVVRSMKDHIHNVMFVQLECVTSKDRNVVLYDGQTIMEDDVAVMDSLGFDVFSIEDYSYTGIPEADVVFINRKFMRN